MKQLLGLLLIFFIAFVSCDNRKSQRQALSESIEEFNKNASIQVDVYIPETYFERVVDTTLNNGFRVTIKTYTDTKNNVLFTKIKDTINYQTFYRNFKFEISVLNNNELIYYECFNKKKANNYFKIKNGLNSRSNSHNFEKLSVLKSIDINHNPSHKNKVQIDVLYTIPDSNKSVAHAIIIDEYGKYNIVQLDIK
jgi:hypothetical protein